MNMAARILEPGDLEPPAGEIPFLFLPRQDLFGRRADRLRLLANGHPQGAYLAFLALIAEAQQETLNRFAAPSLPDSTEQALCREHGMPLLNACSRPRDPAWRQGLATILQQLQGAALPQAAGETVLRLLKTSDIGLEERADAILAGNWAEIAPQELPFVAAGLQVYWVGLAAALGEEAFGRLKQGGVCPVCGSLPTVGIVQSGRPEQGLRYLSCSLCAAQWHLVRVKCSRCESTQGIDYYTLKGAGGAVKAESCDTCNSYLKLLYLEKDSGMEATADDLATLILDILMAKEGKTPVGPNLLFHPGESDKL